MQQYQARGLILSDSSPDYKLVMKIAERVIEAVGRQDGGGYQVCHGHAHPA